MEGQVLNSSAERNSAEGRVADLFADGIPLDLLPSALNEYVVRCRRTLSSLGAGDSLLAVKVMTAEILASVSENTSQTDLEATEIMADEIWLMAERLGDALSRAYALAARGFSLVAPEHSQERVRIARELLTLASETRENVLLPVGYFLLLVGLLEQGQIRELDLELLQQRAELSKPQDHALAYVSSHFTCLRAILDGDTETAEREAELLFRRTSVTGGNALALYTTQLGMIRWMQGRIDGAEQGFMAARREYPEQLLWSASLAWLWLLQGRRASAESLLNSLPDVEEIPRNRFWLSTMTVLAEVARLSGSRENAERIRARLLPFAAHLVPVGVGVAFWGTCARTLGLLEEHLGFTDDARNHLELAVEMSGSLGALAWQAEAQIELAEFAIRHDLTDVPAYELLSEAKATSEARGFAALARRAMFRPRISVMGGFEVISLCGKRAKWTSRKARELLKMLVAARGVATSREVFMDALWLDEHPSALGNRFSVAVNVIRRALDPDRMLPTQHHLVTEGDSIWLNLDSLDIDLERFFSLAKSRDGDSSRAAIELYRGDPFSEEPYADWAVSVREHARRLRATLNS